MRLSLMVKLPKERLSEPEERAFLDGVTDTHYHPKWRVVSRNDNGTTLQFHFVAKVPDHMSDEAIVMSNRCKVGGSLPAACGDLQVTLKSTCPRDIRTWPNHLRYLHPRFNRDHTNIVVFVQEHMPCLLRNDPTVTIPLVRQYAFRSNLEAAVRALPLLSAPALYELYDQVQQADGPGTIAWRRFRMSVTDEVERRQR